MPAVTCLATLFAAAEAVENSPRRPPHSRVACLVTTPDLFSSEVTIFLSEETNLLEFDEDLPKHLITRTHWTWTYPHRQQRVR
ncbi:DUF3916 domain-containing protein [Nocardia colli]|uniref:DUF3916 domain-containing protein n=1 Tax=Nocardia colli TaxID=2545717 RepID=A0A5N0EEN7_9NOCA|nr:DUF3916 domain-containing protein [Nocardia colli]